MTEQNDRLRRIYDVVDDVTTYGPAYDELLTEMELFNSTYKSCLYKVQKMYTDGDVSLYDAEYIARRMSRVVPTAKEDFRIASEILKMQGLPKEVRLAKMAELSKTLRYHRALVSGIYSEMIGAYVRQVMLDYEDETLDELLGTGGSRKVIPDGSPTVNTNFVIEKPKEIRDRDGNSSSSGDSSSDNLTDEQRKYADDLLSRAKKIQKSNSERTLDVIESRKESTIKSALKLTRNALTVVLLFSIPIAFARRNRGERQANDAFYKIGEAMIFAIIALTFLAVIL